MGNQKREKINNAVEGYHYQAEEEEEEKELEEKMDKFYALIRNFRDARDQRRNELLKEMEMKDKNKKQLSQMMMMKKRKAAELQTTLIPSSFRMEDFARRQHAAAAAAAAADQFKRTSLKCPASSSSIKIHEPDDDLDKESGLDLKLAL